MEKWKITKYLIDAKTSVDSILFISRHLPNIQGIDVRKKVKTCLRDFYINCRTVFDNCFPKKTKRKEREEVRKTDGIIQDILYEADKTYAHKDEDYKAKHYDSLEEQIDVLKEQLRHLRKLCEADLPDVVTLDFVPHDRELYRLVNKVDATEEERIKRAKHPLYGKTNGTPIGKSLKVFHDTEDEVVDNVSSYGVILDAGLNEYEGLQNRQDFCIKVNTLYGENMWVSYNPLINPNFKG